MRAKVEELTTIILELQSQLVTLQESIRKEEADKSVRLLKILSLFGNCLAYF